MDGLERFVRAQERSYQTALREMKAGRKRSHWMWYIFPQISGLGRSETARYYAIRDGQEARDYLAHPVLGARLREITAVLLQLEGGDPTALMGWPDDMKLKSSMTLFAIVSGEQLFQAVLEKYFGGQQDGRTQAILRAENGDFFAG